MEANQPWLTCCHALWCYRRSHPDWWGWHSWLPHRPIACFDGYRNTGKHTLTTVCSTTLLLATQRPPWSRLPKRLKLPMPMLLSCNWKMATIPPLATAVPSYRAGNVKVEHCPRCAAQSTHTDTGWGHFGTRYRIRTAGAGCPGQGDEQPNFYCDCAQAFDHPTCRRNNRHATRKHCRKRPPRRPDRIGRCI